MNATQALQTVQKLEQVTHISTSGTVLQRISTILSKVQLPQMEKDQFLRRIASELLPQVDENNISTTIKKIVEDFLRSKHGHVFENCRRVLEAMGYALKSNKGSHFIFALPGEFDTMTIVKHSGDADASDVEKILERWKLLIRKAPPKTS